MVLPTNGVRVPRKKFQLGFLKCTMRYESHLPQMNAQHSQIFCSNMSSIFLPIFTFDAVRSSTMCVHIYHTNGHQHKCTERLRHSHQASPSERSHRLLVPEISLHPQSPWFYSHCHVRNIIGYIV